jgi:WhiB family transcriptional regulator, redox-sensing transcriptional regulator
VTAAYPLDGAVCEGVARADYDPFFPETPEAEADALAMCRICPARMACLAYAVETGQMFGIWGGRTQAQIRRLIVRARAGRPRGQLVPPGHPNADKTHCKHGHPFDAANTYYAANGERRCRACRRARLARARRLAGRANGGER